MSELISYIYEKRRVPIAPPCATLLYIVNDSESVELITTFCDYPKEKLLNHFTDNSCNPN